MPKRRFSRFWTGIDTFNEVADKNLTSAKGTINVVGGWFGNLVWETLKGMVIGGLVGAVIGAIIKGGDGALVLGIGGAVLCGLGSFVMSLVGK